MVVVWHWRQSLASYTSRLDCGQMSFVVIRQLKKTLIIIIGLLSGVVHYAMFGTVYDQLDGRCIVGG